MVLSDRTIRRETEAGNIVIDPLGEDAIQPASVDLRLGHLFRVFRNSQIPFIDVKKDYPDLTELVEIDDDHPFILHPASSRWRSPMSAFACPIRSLAGWRGSPRWAAWGC
jgi:dCTP deaminase